jgi:hypothetical protein
MALYFRGGSFIVNAWTPASLGSALKAWYKADAGVYSDAGVTPAVNNIPVYQWNDQSGNGYHLQQATIGRQPTYLTGILNSLPVLDMNNAGDSQSMMTTGQPFTLSGMTLSGFILYRFTGLGGQTNCRILGISTPGSGDIGSDTAIFDYFPGSSLVAPTTYNNGTKSSGTIVSGSWNQIGSIFDGVNNTMYIANSAQTPIASANTFAASVDIDMWANSSGSASGIGQVAEIIITNTALSLIDRGNLATYLTNKWGI